MIQGSNGRSRILLYAVIFMASVITLGACGVSSHSLTTQQVPGGDAGRGKQTMRRLGCGSCHAIPGIADARGNVGPSLSGMGGRRIVAGLLSNNPTNLMLWLQDPQSVVPGNAMPNQGVTEAEARDMATYLYTLK